MNLSIIASLCRLTCGCAFLACGASVLNAADGELVQDFKKESAYKLVERAEDLPADLRQHSGVWKSPQAYSDEAYKVGLHIRTGKPITMTTKMHLTGWNCSHVLGAHGAGTEVRFAGVWQGDGGSSFPNLVLSEGARFVVKPEAHIDYVLADSFYTRQLWAYGDGTGTIEIEEGFLADRTKAGTVEDAMGTIRLNGVNLVTHHSRNLPFNTRPDGRGAVYPNGHIVWEGQPGSVWTVATNPQTYPAQLDFHADGVIDCQQHLVHNGHKRVTAPAMVGGVFVSTGAFRTCEPGVTITKRGPGMLALEGQQGYYPDASLIVEEGVLKMSTNPGNGYRYDDSAGPYLTIKAHNGARVLLSAEHSQLERIELHDQTRLYSFADSKIVASKGIHVGPEAILVAHGSYTGDVDVQGMWQAMPGDPVTVDGALKLSGGLQVSGNHRLLKTKPVNVPLIKAANMTGTFKDFPEGTPVSVAWERAIGKIHYHDKGVDVIDIVYKPKTKKKKKEKKTK